MGTLLRGGSGRPDDEEALMSSKVHWVVANIAVPAEQNGTVEICPGNHI